MYQVQWEIVTLGSLLRQVLVVALIGGLPDLLEETHADELLEDLVQD